MLVRLHRVLAWEALHGTGQREGCHFFRQGPSCWTRQHLQNRREP